jgi:hypothetical protein
MSDDYMGDDYMSDDCISDDYMSDDYMSDDYMSDDYMSESMSLELEPHLELGHQQPTFNRPRAPSPSSKGWIDDYMSEDYMSESMSLYRPRVPSLSHRTHCTITGPHFPE